jgi:acyl-CoA reductase-like NAD-dependent aldehyde dehydrogenase
MIFPTDVGLQLKRARQAAAEWSQTPVAARCAHLKRVRRAFAAGGDELARTVHEETGKPLVDGLIETAAALPMLMWAGSHAERALRPQRIRTAPFVHTSAWIEHQPYGVVGLISPWNYPIGITFQSLPWMLAAGNTVLYKPSEVTPRTGQLIADLVNSAGRELVFPVHGGGEVGAEVVGSGVGVIAFTGSVATGRRIMAKAAETLTPVIMELGGKDAMIICADADLDRAARACAGSAFSNAGQTCMAPERVLVHEEVADRFTALLLDVVATMTVGPAPDAHVGPVVSERQVDTVLQRLEDAVDGGARVLVGGHRRADLGPRWMEPTIVTDVPPDAALAVEESFAPLMILTRVRSDDEAVAQANDGDFGLSASIFSADGARARRLASRLCAGGVNINDAVVGAGIAALPFGGERSSGIGRLQGEQGFHAFSRQVSITAPRTRLVPPLTATMFTGRRPSIRLVSFALRLAAGRKGSS